MENSDAAAAAAGLGLVILVFVVVSLAIGIVNLIAAWKVFTKAGKPGWAVIIPIYGTLVHLEIVGRPWWWLFLMWTVAIPIIMLFDTARVFGKGAGFGLGLLFLPWVFFPILGFGSARYVGPAAAPSPPQAAAA